MIPRLLLLLFIATTFAARASDKIDAPADGASALVTQPHVTAELIPESTTVEAGKPFDVALHLHSDPEWHTYWINPGDAGLATSIKWTLPEGFTAGPIQWPTPEKHAMGPLITYGYEGDVYLLTTITPPKSDLPQHFDLKAKATWLVCKEECIPGKAELTVPLDSGFMNLRLPKENTELFAAARARLPVENSVWTVTASYQDDPSAPWDPKRVGTPQALHLDFRDKQGASVNLPGAVSLFPEQANVLGTQPADAKRISSSALGIALQQNGEKPEKLSGVLVSDDPLIGNAKAVHIAEFPVTAGPVSVGPDNSLSGSAPAVAGAGPAPVGANAPISASPAASNSTPPTAAQRAAATAEPNASEPAAGTAAATTEAPPLLIAVLGAAFVGGLILNLMPCVLPVLSLKVFSLIKHAGENPKAAWIQGVAFTAGVVLSFWLLAGALLALRAAGNQLGWGFQMQSPGFVLGLILLFFLIGLNLFGVFEVGTSLVGLDAKAAGHGSGTTSSFFNGALATLAATPCTAPFMGSAVGFAAQQPAFVSMLIFTFLALGMATPYLLLTLFPATLRFVPKPGAWMEAFKQFMGFLLMATVIFLLYVFTGLTNSTSTIDLLGALLLVSVGAWIYGRWSSPSRPVWTRRIACLLAIAFLVGGIAWGLGSRSVKAAMSDNGENPDDPYVIWQPWSPKAVQEALARGQPVFVDFTAAWCLSCKVNERVALDTASVSNAFTQKNVALFTADWTRSDPAISQTLQHYHRDGVPLYLLYSPKAKDDPQVLPEVLTPGIVLDALNKM